MKKRESYRLSDEKIEYLKNHYAETANDELAERLNISISCVRRYCTKLRLRKSKEFLAHINSERAIRCNNAAHINTPEAYAKRTETRRKLYEEERVRIKWGLPQLTKRHFTSEPRAKLLQRNRLIRLGYIVDNKKLIAYYTPETKRAVRIERIPRGQTKGSITSYYEFKEYENNAIGA